MVLDTCAVIAIKRDPKLIADVVPGATKLYLPVIVLGELFNGAFRGRSLMQELQRIEEFAQRATVLECDRMTAFKYGQIKSQLKKKGRPIPENDIWIAALAVQHDLTLLTNNAHFQSIPNLRLLSW